tara:strand:+ start:3011 stop:4357 length:1347 start_codon:yes stop_codon:yes gene_type:complete
MRVQEQQFLWMIFTQPELGRGLGSLKLSDAIANRYYTAIQDPEVNEPFLAIEKAGLDQVETIEYFDQFKFSGYIEKNAQKLIDYVKNNSTVNNFKSELINSLKTFDASENKMSAINTVIENLITSVKNNGSDTKSTLGQAVVETYEYLEDVLNGKIDKGLCFGLKDVDELVTANKGDLCVIAGRSGSGKTAAGLQFVVNQLYQNKKGMFFSLEMPKRNLIMRMLANLSETHLSKIKSGQAHGEDHVYSKSQFLLKKQKDIIICDKGMKPISEICNDARIQNLKTPIDYIVIDYAQLITDDLTINKNALRTESIGKITKALKSLAKEIDIPVILLAQVSRSVDDRTLGGWMGKPTRADISDSKEIENDCDSLITLYAPYRYDKHRDDPALAGKIMWNVVKNRDGEEGEAWVNFVGEYQKMYSVQSDFNYTPNEKKSVRGDALKEKWKNK